MMIHKEVEAIKKKKTHRKSRAEELKNTMTELKNSVDSFNSRLDQAEERINGLKNMSSEIIQSEEQKEKE